MREPDFVIGDPKQPYMLRWWVIPRNRFFNVYLHKFLKSDDDRALHDHPWLFNASLILKGEYLEHKLDGKVKWRRPRRFYFRWGKAPHRVELLLPDDTPVGAEAIWPEEPVWTLFITGPIVREWGFYCPQGWKAWRDFVRTRPGGNERGDGCGDGGKA